MPTYSGITLNPLYPTVGPENRYQAIMFTEKEGFDSLFDKIGLDVKFDIGLMSTKGQSVTASRKLADVVCGLYRIPLFVLVDFDITGFEIEYYFRTSNRRYTFKNDFDVIHLGLRLDDVQECGLASEPFKVPKNARERLQKYGATAEEIDFLCSGQRVELNQFTSDQLVKWLEAKLTEIGMGKLVPKSDVLKKAFRRSACNHYIEERLPELQEEAAIFADGLPIPRDLKRKVTERLKADPRKPWDLAVAEIVGQRLSEDAAQG